MNEQLISGLIFLSPYWMLVLAIFVRVIASRSKTEEARKITRKLLWGMFGIIALFFGIVLFGAIAKFGEQPGINSMVGFGMLFFIAPPLTVLWLLAGSVEPTQSEWPDAKSREGTGDF